MNNNLSIEIAKASQLAATVPQSLLISLQRHVGDDFILDEAGLDVAEGASISTEKMSFLISFLGKASETGRASVGMINLLLGDAIILTRELYGDEVADNLIAQATKTTGQMKHTVQEAERTVQFLNKVYEDKKDRPTNLTYSHFMELKNGAQVNGELVIPAEKVREIASTVAKGHLDERVESNGNVYENRTPLSTKETRELIYNERPEEYKKKPSALPGEKVVDVEPEPDPQPTEKPIRFIYIYRRDPTDVVYSTDDWLDDDLCTEDYIILDVKAKEVLNPEQEPIAAFTEI